MSIIEGSVQGILVLMIIIGLTGPIGHGKSTFAKAIEKLEPETVRFESSLIIADVANRLQQALRTIPDPYDVTSLNNWLRILPEILEASVSYKCRFTDIMLDQAAIEQHPIEYQKLIMHVENLARQPELAKQTITKANKEVYRPLLQWLGGYLSKKLKPEIWYDEIVRRIYDAQSKGKQLCIVGGLRFPTDAATIRHAGGVIIKVYRPGHLQNDMLDPTERERDDIPIDCTIMSNGTFEDVSRCAIKVLEDIRDNRLASLYQTKHI